MGENNSIYYSWNYEDERQHSGKSVELKPDTIGEFLSDKGGREENQDAWGFTIAADKSLVLAVADGLGGHAGGRTASQDAIAGCLKAANKTKFNGLSQQSLGDMFLGAHQAIKSNQAEQPELKSMRSTLVVLIIGPDYQIRWGHVGDVRLYLVRNGRIVHQTKDHSVPQMLVDAGELEPEQIRNHPDRNRLLRSLGQEEEPKPNLSGTGTLEKGDLLVMATDGFWEWVDEDFLIKASKLAQTNPPIDKDKKLIPYPCSALVEAEKVLLKAAKAHDSEFDNYTALFLARLPDPFPESPVKKSFWRFPLSFK
jgi:serine/threonine protein phosphatase PrpC